MKVAFGGISKYFGQAAAIGGADFTIEDGEFFTLLGPSGCGKTTLLRIIAGFYRQDRGDLYFGPRLMNDVPAHQRNIGMVFQNYAIFPHLSVFDNVAYGLRARKLPKPQIERKVSEALEMVELEHLRSRSPADMSGGQQQRIALARAVVIEPELLLMDEPLSNLDAKLRIKMRSDIRALQQRLNITTIYVTHDQEEAMAVSDRIAVMNGGVVQQIGAPRDIYRKPVNRTVASFIGTSNFVEGTVTAYEPATGSAVVGLGAHTLRMKLARAYEGKALLSVRPEQLRLTGSARPERGLPVSGVVTRATFLGGKMHYEVNSELGPLEVEEQMSEPSEPYREGRNVFVELRTEHAVLFDGQGEEALNFA